MSLGPGPVPTAHCPARAVTIQVAARSSGPAGPSRSIKARSSAGRASGLRWGCSRRMAPSAPTREQTSTIALKLPLPTRSSRGVISISTNPASLRIARTRPGSENENQPELVISLTSFGGRCGAALRSGRWSSSFSSKLRQQTNPSLPVGRSALLRLRKAIVGSAKNMTPNREKTASNDPVSKRGSCASPHTKPTLSGKPGSRWATWTAARNRSRPMTRPPAPTAAASTAGVPPIPQPRSRTRSPGESRSASSAARPSGSSCSSSGSRISSQLRTRG